METCSIGINVKEQSGHELYVAGTLSCFCIGSQKSANSVGTINKTQPSSCKRTESNLRADEMSRLDIYTYTFIIKATWEKAAQNNQPGKGEG